MTRSGFLTVATLLLPVASPAFAQANACTTIPPDARITEVGAFSNMRYTEEHAYGYTVMLWRTGPCLIGLFESSQGLGGDTPIGELRDVRYDGNAGRLSFSAKLTTGVTSTAGSNVWVPSQDLYRFEGTLRPPQLSGVVTFVMQNASGAQPTRDDVVLRQSPEQAEFMPGTATYREWRAKWEPILKVRGPRW